MEYAQTNYEIVFKQSVSVLSIIRDVEILILFWAFATTDSKLYFVL